MKKLIFHLCLFFIPTLVNCKNYDDYRATEKQIEYVKNRHKNTTENTLIFANGNNFTRKMVNYYVKQDPTKAQNGLEGTTCLDIFILLHARTRENSTVIKMVNKQNYPDVHTLHEERIKNCTEEFLEITAALLAERDILKMNELPPTESKPAIIKKPAIPANYNSIIKLFTSTNCVQKQEEYDQTILNKIAQKNNRRTRLEKNLKYFMICASPF